MNAANRWMQLGVCFMAIGFIFLPPETFSADEDGQEVGQIDEPGQALPSRDLRSTMRTASLSPMMQEIRAAMMNRRLEVERASELLRTSPTPTETHAHQLAIEQLKRESEINVLSIQLRYARQDGRAGTIERLETAIASLTQPRPAAQSK